MELLLSILPAVLRGLQAALAAFLAVVLIHEQPAQKPGRTLSLCVGAGIVYGLIPPVNWLWAAAGVLFVLFGLAVWLLLRPPVLYAAVAALLAALLCGTLELLQQAAGVLVLPLAMVLAAVCWWKQLTVLPANPEILISADHRQAKNFLFSTATAVAVLVLPTAWVWYQCSIAPLLPHRLGLPLAWFAAGMVLTLLILLRQLAFAAVQRIEALIDKQYQAELLNLMQIIRSQRHDFNFHIQAISGMIEQGKYAECSDYVRSMVKTTTVMNDMLPLHDPAVSAMINSFREMASQKNIEFQVAISNDLQQIPCTTYEINTIIGNLIQNAIDELTQHRELRSWLSVLILKRGGNHIIKVTNPCHQQEQQLRSCFQPGFTTKQSHEGIGLTTVMRIVTRYHGAVFTEFDRGMVSFVVQIPGIFH